MVPDDFSAAADNVTAVARDAADALADAAGEAVDTAAQAVDAAIDELTGVPTRDGAIEEFTHDRSTLIAERRGRDGSTATLVLVHGIGMGRKVFADLVRRFDDDSLVVAVDLPGYGEAPEPARTPTIERMADLVAAYLRRLDRGPVILLGHSMGTQVVTEVAVRHPASSSSLRLSIAVTAMRSPSSSGSVATSSARAARCFCSAPASICAPGRICGAR